MKSLLVDTGFLVAVIDSSEKFHKSCVNVLQRISGKLVTSEPVITETLYLLRNFPNGVEAILKNLEQGTLSIEFNLEKSLEQISHHMHRFKNVPISLADASLICIAEKVGSGAILTLDSDFHFYRWGKGKKFQSLIPGVFDRN